MRILSRRDEYSVRPAVGACLDGHPHVAGISLATRVFDVVDHAAGDADLLGRRSGG